LNRPSIALVLAALALPAGAQDSPTVGVVVEGDCSTERDVLATGGELYAVKLDGFGHDDWQADATAKGGPRVGLVDGDVAGGTFQVLDNWSRPTHPSHAAFVLVTFPDGRLHLDSGATDGFNFLGSARVQQVGDSPAALPAGAGVVLPGTRDPWTADLGGGPVAFPRPTPGGVEIAFAPLAELSAVDVGGCTLGGAVPDPTSGAGLVIGYNAYRIPDAGTVPTPAEIGDPARWVAFLPFGFGLAVSSSLAALHDPDAQPYSGDEVVVFHDGRLHGDGSPRSESPAPDPTGATSYWYAFQPVVEGRLDAWTSVSLAGGVPTDLTMDVDGDGLPDAVDFDPGFANGPELVSPQAEAGFRGLGLTNGGLPLLSRPVLGTPGPCLARAASDYSVDDLRVRVEWPGQARLSWSDRVAVVGPGTTYDVASDRLSVLWAARAADAKCVARGLAGTELVDPRPAPGDGWYYLVRAVDPCAATPDEAWGADSFGRPRPSCP
jgi:hypothetical protein